MNWTDAMLLGVLIGLVLAKLAYTILRHEQDEPLPERKTGYHDFSHDTYAYQCVPDCDCDLLHIACRECGYLDTVQGWPGCNEPNIKS